MLNRREVRHNRRKRVAGTQASHSMAHIEQFFGGKEQQKKGSQDLKASLHHYLNISKMGRSAHDAGENSCPT